MTINMRNSKKTYVIYAVGIFVVCSVGLVMKNFNDQIWAMSESVHSYQQMIEKQAEKMKSVSLEKERFKRELVEEKEVNDDNIKELNDSLDKLTVKLKTESSKHSLELSDLKKTNYNLGEQHRKLENKYKTLSKSNGAAIAEIETLKSDNKMLRSQLNDASTSKATEMLQLRDSMARISLERDRFKDQYSALFKQHQQSFDSIQLLQTEKDRLQEQIREIQRLSGSVGDKNKQLKNSSPTPEQNQAQPDDILPKEEQIAGEMGVSSSTERAAAVPQVMEEPGQPINSSSTSSAPKVARSQVAAQAPPPVQNQQQVVAAPYPALNLRAVDKAAQLARYPPAQPVKQLKQVYPAMGQQGKIIPQYYPGSYQGRQQEYYQPQVAQGHLEQPHNNAIDVMQAPRVKHQPYFESQGLQPWYPGQQAYQQAQKVPSNWVDERWKQGEQEGEEIWHPESQYQEEEEEEDKYQRGGRDF